MRNKISYTTKIEFLLCFKAAFDATISKSNILGGFRGASLVPLNLEAVISKLDLRLRTPSQPPAKDTPWQSQTPSNTLEFGSQLKLIRERIQRYIDSSLTSMVNTLEKLSKGAEIAVHQLVLVRN
ncbi:hypothetical protein PTT_07584 [Pyrenophora teres f. teres 0-1]|uniref:Uncharacterized protein n=1 Tax=Pyrenophora teres f. teres (strain 0-1) TaxID=861557 RepID=E3RHZ3_PYRTT|nr:hypothetical protein PTT_07584 [Pyrenophora teres f. teres 0-1]